VQDNNKLGVVIHLKFVPMQSEASNPIISSKFSQKFFQAGLNGFDSHAPDKKRILTALYSNQNRLV